MARWQPGILPFKQKLIRMRRSAIAILDASCWLIGCCILRVGCSAVLEQSCFMLRSSKFRPFEKVILFAIGFLLIAASVACAFLAFRDGRWRLGFASGGGLILALVYFGAARRGKPL